MRLSIVIELDYTPDDCTGPLSTSYVEQAVNRSMKPFFNMEGFTQVHIEAANGSLKEAFGIEEYESQKVVLEAQLSASLKAVQK